MLLLDDAVAGGGCLVLCTGEAGIGKTRLAEEAAASAAARGVSVAWARAADRDSLPPYGLWQLVLDEPAVRAADDDPSGVGLWSRVFGDAERPALADGADSGSAQRFAMFAEVRRRLAQAARPGGLLLVLDDLQWADEASAVLLADVVRQLRGTLILVLATYRESAASDDTNAGLLPRLSADANTERVDLGGLPAGAVGEMLLAAGLPALADRAGEVHSETGGNPFLVRELARMLAEQRAGGPVPVPGRVAEATAHRLAQLSDPARALVRTAAVAGNSFSAGVVARILGVPVLALLGPPGIPPGHYPARSGTPCTGSRLTAGLNRPGGFGGGVRATATGAGRSCDRGRQETRLGPRPAQRHILRLMPEQPSDAAWLKLGAEPGLCGACRHAKLNETGRGTAYLRCTRAAWDITLSRYPRLPVTECGGYERREGKP